MAVFSSGFAASPFQLGPFDALLGARAYVGVATHDEWLIGEAERLLRGRGLDRRRYEFQMLLGVRPGRAAELVAAGDRVRGYAPSGGHWDG